MNCWAILEIEPTTDQKVIKKAYARLLKVYHPESDPSGFQRLREAYEQANKQSRWMFLKLPNANVIDAGKEKEPKSTVKVESYEENDVEDCLRQTSDETIEEFMAKVNRIFQDDNLRSDVKEWEVLLQDESYWQLEIRQKLNYRLLWYLQEHYEVPRYHLPNNVWRVLDDYFFWSQQVRELYDAFPYLFVDYIMRRIGSARKGRNNGEKLGEYPKYLLPALFLAVLTATAVKGFSLPLQLHGQSWFWVAAMFVGGLFWGGAINFRHAKWLESKGIFEWVAPYCSYCNRRYNKRFPVLWFFHNRKQCIDCGKNILPHALTTEVVMGLVFACAICIIANGLLMLKLLFVFSIMIFISLMENSFQAILDKVVIALAVVGGILNLAIGAPSLQEMAIGAVAGGSIFLFIIRYSHGFINKDFAKLVAAVGIVLGWKLLLIALLIWLIGLIVIGFFVLKIKQWREVGIHLISITSSCFYIGVPCVILGGSKGVLIPIILWFAIVILMIGQMGLQSRFRVIPSAAVLMMATYITLLFK